jgi:hypothetical protein
MLSKSISSPLIRCYSKISFRSLSSNELKYEKKIGERTERISINPSIHQTITGRKRFYSKVDVKEVEEKGIYL